MLNSKKDHLTSAFVADPSEFQLGARLPRKGELVYDSKEHKAACALSAFEQAKDIAPDRTVVERAMKIDAKERDRWEAFHQYVGPTTVRTGLPTPTWRNLDLSSLNLRPGPLTYNPHPGAQTRGFSEVGEEALARLQKEMTKAMIDSALAALSTNNEALTGLPWTTAPNLQWFTLGDSTTYGAEAEPLTALEIAELEEEIEDVQHRLYNANLSAWQELRDVAGVNTAEATSIEAKRRFIREAKACMALPKGFTHWFGNERHSEYKFLDASLATVEVLFFDGTREIDAAFDFYWGRGGFDDDTYICGYRFICPI